MKQEQMKIWERFLKGLLVMTGILFIATGIGYLFRYLGFSEENIIIVYILGVLIIAIITVNRGWSVCYSLLSVLLFNFLFTEPRFTFSSYDYGYPVTFVTVFIAAMIVSNLTIQIRKQGYRAEQMALRTRILLETNQMLQKAKNADEMIEETARHLMRMMGKNVIYYRAEDGILSEPGFVWQNLVQPRCYTCSSGNGRLRSGCSRIENAQEQEWISIRMHIACIWQSETKTWSMA